MGLVIVYIFLLVSYNYCLVLFKGLFVNSFLIVLKGRERGEG